LTGTEDVEVIDRLKGTWPVGREVEKEVVIGLDVVLAGAVVRGMGIFGGRILGTDRIVVLKDVLLTLNVGSAVTRGVTVVSPLSGRDGRREVGKGRDAFKVSESPIETLERSPSTDVTSGMDGVGRLGSPVIFSTEEAILSTADVIGGTIGGTMFGTSVGPDVAVAVVSNILTVIVISGSPVAVTQLSSGALDPKTSPAGVLFAGLVATRGGNVVNSFGRTRSGSGAGEVVTVPLIASAARSVEAEEVSVMD